MTKKIAIFRCDGGPNIGNGHIMRSFILAKKLKEKKITCYFLLKKYNLFLKNYIRSEFKIIFIDTYLKLSNDQKSSDQAISELIKKNIRKILKNYFQKKPEVEVHIFRN